jgi:hypothetical protein
MDTGQIANASPSADERMFEYDQLRKEILHNDTLTMQILGGVVVVASALMSVAFGINVQNLLIKGLLFFFAEIIAIIGLGQTIDRERSTFIIASYLRTFIEPNTTGIKWESRLREFRTRSHAKSALPSYGEFINYQRFTYLFLIAINFLSSAGCVLYELRCPPGIYFAGTGILCNAVLTIWLLRWAWLASLKYTVNHDLLFDPIWQGIRIDEEKRPR